VENLDILTIKLNKLVESYKKLKEDNYRLRTELDFFKKEVKEHKSRLNENILLKEKQKKAILKAEQILEKINSMKVL
jgi:cell division septum initiation protein DivIVA